MVKLRFRLGSSYRKAIGTLHCALENGSDLHVNEHQKIRHYRARSTDEESRMPNGNFYFMQHAQKLCYYGDVIHSFDWKSAVEHNGGV